MKTVLTRWKGTTEAVLFGAAISSGIAVDNFKPVYHSKDRNSIHCCGTGGERDRIGDRFLSKIPLEAKAILEWVNIERMQVRQRAGGKDGSITKTIVSKTLCLLENAYTLATDTDIIYNKAIASRSDIGGSASFPIYRSLHIVRMCYSHSATVTQNGSIPGPDNGNRSGFGDSSSIEKWQPFDVIKRLFSLVDVVRTCCEHNCALCFGIVVLSGGC